MSPTIRRKSFQDFPLICQWAKAAGVGTKPDSNSDKSRLTGLRPSA
jgi:hypothetical protein